MITIVLYHSGCTDGFCAAWLFKKAFPDAELIPVQYGDNPPGTIADNDDIYIVDFSFPRDVMIDLNDKCKTLVVLDHHKTAQENCEGLDFCTFDMHKSGAHLAWYYLLDNGLLHKEDCGSTADAYTPDLLRPPWLVSYTEDRDLWRFNLVMSKEINAAIRSHPMDIDAWDDLALEKPTDIAKEGTAIVRYRKQIIDQHVRHAQECILGGHKIKIVCCTTEEIISEVAEQLCTGDNQEYPFGCCYFDTDDSRVYSLRSRGVFDVGELAKKFGGGGHKNAAGFNMPM